MPWEDFPPSILCRHWQPGPILKPCTERTKGMAKKPARKKSADPDFELLNVKEAAKLLRVTPSTLDHYRCEGKGPIFRKHGTRVFYTRASLMEWSASRRFSSTSNRLGQTR